jgi:L-asparagine permease
VPAPAHQTDLRVIGTVDHVWACFRRCRHRQHQARLGHYSLTKLRLVSGKVFGEMEFWFSIVKVGALVVFMGIGIFLLVTQHPIDGTTPGPQLLTDHGGILPHGLLPLVLVVQGAVFAYAALELVGVAAGETADPEKVMPKAINSIMWRIAVFYVGSVVLLAMLMPWSSFRSAKARSSPSSRTSGFPTRVTS